MQKTGSEEALKPAHKTCASGGTSQVPMRDQINKVVTCEPTDRDKEGKLIVKQPFQYTACWDDSIVAKVIGRTNSHRAFEGEK